jgi:TPR repeat protein
MKAAADQGLAHACYCLGNFYNKGTGVDADKDKAFEYYRKAAEQGDSDGLERLGECYEIGIGVPMDKDAAFRCMQRSAEMGNPKGQCYLGLYLLNGIGCRQDTEIAFRWISRAVDTGFPIVSRILENSGLDIGKLSDGYKQFRQIQIEMSGQRFGENFDRVFSGVPMSIQPTAPGGV